MQDRLKEPRQIALPMYRAACRTGQWKALFFMLLLGVSMITSVPLVTMVPSARAANIDPKVRETIMKDTKLANALGFLLNESINCFRQTELWKKTLSKIVTVKKEEYPDWSAAAVRNGERLSGEGTCSMEKMYVPLCGIHEVIFFWGKHDRKCWFRNNGDGGRNNWHMFGQWTRSDNGRGKEAWIGY